MTDLLNVSEVKLIYLTKIKASDRLAVKQSKDAFDIFMKSWDVNTIEHHETFKVLLLNRSNKVLGLVTVSEGGINGTVTDIKIIFQAAIKANASGIIICHNHPSGNLSPSESDSKITGNIKDGGKFLDIQLLDHLIIIPDQEYYSFADNGIL